MVEKIKRAVGALRGKRIAILGLTFKPNTDDIRESPALDILAGLVRAGAKIVAYDPAGMAHVRKLPIGAKIAFAEDAYDAAKGADCAVLVTEWNELRSLDLKRLARAMKKPLLCDLRNVYEPEEAQAAGLRYVGVGRGGAR